MDVCIALSVRHDDRTAKSGKVEFIGSGIISDGVLDPESVIIMDGMAKGPP